MQFSEMAPPTVGLIVANFSQKCMRKVVEMDLFNSLRLGGCLYILQTFLLKLVISEENRKNVQQLTKILDISAWIKTKQDALGNA